MTVPTPPTSVSFPSCPPATFGSWFCSCIPLWLARDAPWSSLEHWERRCLDGSGRENRSRTEHRLEQVKGLLRRWRSGKCIVNWVESIERGGYRAVVPDKMSIDVGKPQERVVRKSFALARDCLYLSGCDLPRTQTPGHTLLRQHSHFLALTKIWFSNSLCKTSGHVPHVPGGTLRRRVWHQDT